MFNRKLKEAVFGKFVGKRWGYDNFEGGLIKQVQFQDQLLQRNREDIDYLKERLDKQTAIIAELTDYVYGEKEE